MTDRREQRARGASTGLIPLDDRVEVMLVEWPEESAVREQLAIANRPRLLLLAPGVDPPQRWDPLEDWIRTPADRAELQARVATLRIRAEATSRRPPSLDDDGILRHRGTWVALTPIELSIMEPLVERFGRMVPRQQLTDAAWPAGTNDPRALNARVKLLRKRIRPLGLAIRAVPARGFLLEGM